MIAYWSIFRIAALKSLPYDFNVYAMLVLASADAFPLNFRSPWFLVWQIIWLKPRNFGYHVMRLHILFKPSILADFFWRFSGKGRGAALLLSDGSRNSDSPSSFLWYPRWGKLPLPLGGHGISGSPCGLHWHLCWTAGKPGAPVCSLCGLLCHQVGLLWGRVGHLLLNGWGWSCRLPIWPLMVRGRVGLQCLWHRLVII